MSKSKDVNFNRVCVVLVEGPSDKQALFNILYKHFLAIDKKVHVYVFHTDITSDNRSNPKNIEQRIVSFINSELTRNKLKFSDIYRIIHITDLDGCYVQDSNIVYDENCKEPFYELDKIKTNRVDRIKLRNKTKSQNIDHLLTIKSLTYGTSSAPYELYFMSCNLDHVLYNKNNISDEEKAQNAELFAERFLDEPETFIDFLKTEGVIIDGTYVETWKYAKKNGNSLRRKTNIDKALK